MNSKTKTCPSDYETIAIERKRRKKISSGILGLFLITHLGTAAGKVDEEKEQTKDFLKKTMGIMNNNEDKRENVKICVERNGTIPGLFLRINFIEYPLLFWFIINFTPNRFVIHQRHPRLTDCYR